MALMNEKGGDRRRSPEKDPRIDTTDSKSSKKRKSDADVGSALRSAYQRTVSEDIPPEMLDLLGKLG